MSVQKTTQNLIGSSLSLEDGASGVAISPSLL